jgi:type I restriction enzyme S subunit
VSQKCVQWSGFDLNPSRFVDDNSLSGYQDERYIRDNDILWNSTGTGTVGRAIVVKKSQHTIVADSHVTIIRPLATEPNHILNYISSPSVQQRIEPDHENSLVSGTTKQVELNSSSVKLLAVPLPPEEEQHRIVEKVDELMALCDRLEQQVGDQLEAHEVLVDTLLDALSRSEDAAEVADNWARIAEHFDTLFTTEASIDKLKQTILQLAVMGRLVPQDPDDEPASVLLEKIAEAKARLVNEGKARKQKPLPEIAYDEYPFYIPTGWVISRMDDITDIQSGIAKGKKLSGKQSTWLPYLRVANVQRGGLDLSEVKEIEIACDEAERYSVKKRDLLITEGGDWDKVGRTAIWNAEIDPMAHQNHVFRARLILDEQNEKWIEKYLNSGFAREYFADSSKQTTNLASINKTQLRSCTVPIPPLEEQQRIIEKIDELMALCDHLKARLSEAGETRTQLAETVVEKAVQ